MCRALEAFRLGYADRTLGLLRDKRGRDANLQGVAQGHNAFEDAQQRIASPDDVAGHADVYAHNVLDDTWTSRLTSWSTEREVAEGFAGKNGVILQTTIEEMQARGVNILESPDVYEESEILLEGRIEGLQVTQP